MDPNWRPVAVGLACVIVVCTAILLFVHFENAASMDFIGRVYGLYRKIFGFFA